MEAVPLQWLQTMPPVTKSYILLSSALSIAEYTGLFKSSDITIESDSLINTNIIWKIPLNLLYNGSISLDFFTKLYFFTRYSNWLETSFNSSYSYIWMTTILISLIYFYCLSIVNLFMWGPTLKTALLYIWTKRNPNVEVLLFVLIIKSVWVPWVSLLLDISLSRRNNNYKFWLINLSGILIGHLYWFINDQLPLLFKSKSIFRPYWEWRNEINEEIVNIDDNNNNNNDNDNEINNDNEIDTSNNIEIDNHTHNEQRDNENLIRNDNELEIIQDDNNSINGFQLANTNTLHQR